MNNSMLFFNPVFPLWMVLLLVGLLFSFFIWKEFQRKQKFKTLRMMAQVLVMIAILGILLRPGFRTEKQSTGIVILTPGYNKTQVDSLLTVQPDFRLMYTPGTEPYGQAETLTSYFDLPLLEQEIHVIMGEGLPEYALSLLTKKEFQFIPAALPVGVTQLQIPQSVKVNQQAVVSGHVNATSTTKLILVGPGGAEDSVIVKPNSHAFFKLKFKSKQSGRFIYTLTCRNERGTTTEKLPIEVVDEQKLGVLLLQKFPSFEVRQLKNFLAEKGHKLTLRYQVSKNSYRYEYANTTPVRITQLTSALLQSFDLVIIDALVLESMNQGEKNSLEQLVHNGLGLILLSDQASERDKIRERYFPVVMKKALKDTAQLNLNNKTYTLPVVPLLMNEQPSLFPITQNQSRIFSGYVYSGLGKIGIQLLQETYRIALEGNTDGYSSLWTPLLEKTSRSKSNSFKIKITTAFPSYPEEPLGVQVIATTNDFPVLTDENSFTLPLAEDVIIDNTWMGKTWAGDAGWHQLKADSTTLNYFVVEEGSWKSLRSANTIAANTLASGGTQSALEARKIEQSNMVSLIVFYLLFLLASGFLWVAPKI